jgi:hypothetical protein
MLDVDAGVDSRRYLPVSHLRSRDYDGTYMRSSELECGFDLRRCAFAGLGKVSERTCWIVDRGLGIGI